MSIGPEAEKMAKIILEWIEQNPEVPKHLTDSLENIQKHSDNAKRTLGKLGNTLGDHLKLVDAVADTYNKDLVDVLKGSHRQYEYLLRAAGAVDKQKERQMEDEKKREAYEQQRFSRWSSRVQGWSRTAGWLGYRLTMMGRIVTRWFTAPLTAGIRTLTEWEKTMLTVASGMGLASMSGRDFTGSLMPLLTMLPEVGIETQGAWNVLKSMLAGIQTMFGPTVNDAMWQIATSLDAIWASLEVAEIPEAFDTFVKTHLPDLLSAVEKFAPGFAEGLVNGLNLVTPAITGFLEAIGPHAETIGVITGYLGPLAIALTALGTALFFLAPGLNILSSLLGLLGLGGATAAAAGTAGTVGGATVAGAGMGSVGLAALAGGLFGAWYAEKLKKMFPEAVITEPHQGIPGPGSAEGKLDFWKMLGSIFNIGGGDAGTQITGAMPGRGDVNIYGDIYFPEGMTEDEMIRWFQDYIAAEESGYPPNYTESLRP